MAVRRELFDPTDPASLPPTDRITGVAAILAAGVIRMRTRQAVSVPKVRLSRNTRSAGAWKSSAAPSMSQIPSDSGGTRLEVSGSSRPDGQRG